MTTASRARVPLPKAPGLRDTVGRMARYLDGPLKAQPVGVGLAPWDRLAARARRHPGVVDATWVLLLVAAITIGPLWHSGHPSVETVVLRVALLVPLIGRRRYPVGVFVTVSAVAFVQWLFADHLVADVSLLLALSTVAVHRPRRTALAAAGILEIGVVMATFRWTANGARIHGLVAGTALVAAALLLGTNVRARRAHVATLLERAERLEHERDQQALMAAVAERTRIAREMHDVLAHSLAVMISLADGAAAKLATEPDRAATAIAHVSDLGRQSLRDTRRLVGVLRDDDSPDPTAPQPDISQLGDLMSQVQATGLDASLDVSGEPFDVAPAAGLAVYRIVQEALTNSLKHATGMRAVRVRLRYRAPELDVEVSDDGHAPPAADPLRSGHGLTGMRERASVYRGSVTAGPAPDGGWLVRARMPVGPGGRP